MANSKSNIYPIQLQGAELCLNRYDAEIKQYRGFNKNNSPFVGGCLSNVFTKEEQISGGNADNVYIDNEGNVFNVDDEGLYKNGNKLIDYSASESRPNGIYFFKKRKLDVSDVVKAISETVYITVESQIECPADTGMWRFYPYISSGYVAHWGNGHSAFLCDVTNLDMLILDIAYKDGKIAFTAKKNFYTGLNQQSTLNYMIYVPDENDSYYKDFSSRTLGGASIDDPCFNGEAKACRLAHIEVPQTVYFGDTGLFWAQNMTLYSRILFIDYETENYTSAYSFTTTANVMDLDFTSWFMDKYGHLYFYRFGIENRGQSHNHLTSDNTVKKEYSIAANAGMQNLKYYMRISFNEGSFSAAALDTETSSLGVNVGSTATTFEGTSGSRKGYNDNQVIGFFKSYGCQYFTKINNKAGGNSHIYFSFCQYRINYGNYAEEGTGLNRSLPAGGQFFLEPFKVLINNNQLSNLSIYCESQARVVNLISLVQGNTVEDWNTIEEIEYIDTDKCVYKTFNDDYFVIEKTAPKLMVKYNQIVVNCNYELNAYDLIQQKITHFAPDWNNTIIKYKGYSSGVMNNYLNHSYFTLAKIASSINEYNLKDNPSLLLNQIMIIKEYLNWKNYEFLPYDMSTYPSCVYISLLKDNAINFYSDVWGSATPSEECIYRFSGSVFFMYNDDLIDLPFPDNKDGNVQYAPNIFSEFIYNFGIDVFVKNGKNVYQLMKEGQESVMAFFLGTLVENLDKVFIIQGQYYGIFEDKIFSIQFQNGVISSSSFIVNVQNLEYVGNTPYEALFFSKTNRCLYSFTGANVLNQKQLVDKISEVRNYLYNPATQTVFLITDIGVLFYGLFGMFLLEYTDITNIFLLNNGIALSDNNGNYRYIKYYLDEGDEGYTKENINIETSFYGMNNEVVTINDCLYFRIFSEEHEEGDLKVSATTISLSGRKTEETIFKIKASDWDKITHTIYLRYQPKTQRGLGVAFAIDSPFKIASLSVGSQPDAVLVDKVSKGAITAPSVTTNNDEW